MSAVPDGERRRTRNVGGMGGDQKVFTESRVEDVRDESLAEGAREGTSLRYREVGVVETFYLGECSDRGRER